jgi:hypothetical protein
MFGRVPHDRPSHDHPYDEPVPDERPGTPVLERHMVRLSVADLTEERARCSDCGRTPLIGELVHVYVRGEIVCELCRALRTASPVATERMRHAEFGSTVRLRRLA